jgi:hypothetical protein
MLLDTLMLYVYLPLVPQCSLIIADINLFGVALLLDPQVLILLHRGLPPPPKRS